MKVLNFGSLNIDKVYNVENFVKPGETISSLAYSEKCGGKGLNQSIALKKAGVENLYHAGKIAPDGKMLLQALKDSGVDTQFLMENGSYTGHAIIQVDSAGQNNIILFGGANTEIKETEVLKVLDNFETGDKIILQNEISCMSFIIEECYKKGIEIYLNPSPITPALLAYPLDKVTMFLMNEIEAKALSGKSNPDEAIEVLKIKYPNAKFLITLGKAGAKYYNGRHTYFASAFKVKAVDTTAAGDTFTGFFLQGIFSGKDAQTSLQIASKASAIAVMTMGAAESIPFMHQVENAVL